MPFLGRKVIPYKGQDYEAIKKDLLKTGSLFEDPLFGADGKSLSYKQPPSGVEWKRPGVSFQPLVLLYHLCLGLGSELKKMFAVF